jgi:ABC-type dipeptide/oligopeptide/nickel transport system ATPase subunit
VEFIRRIWAYLESDAQARVNAAELACQQRMQSLNALKLSYFEVDSAARRLIEGELAALVPGIESQLDAFSARRDALISSLGSEEMQTPPPMVRTDYADVESVADSRKARIAKLQASDAAEHLRAREAELRTLRHRLMLGRRMAEIKEYVEKRKWAATVRGCLGSTRQITDTYNELFEELVTGRYAELFQETLRRFKARMSVTIQMHGKKGDRLRQIALSPEVFQAEYAVEQVLSDGEKTAVAIADFLTEARLDDSCSGIILDDPITSLDNEWKEVLAECLAEGATKRQAIIFTHDLAFAYHITESARKLGVAVAAHWIREEDGKPGFVYVDNSPLCERQFKSADRARRFYSEAKTAKPEEQESMLQQGFGALRTSYEALVVFELFNGVVGRFEERIRFDNLKDVCFERKDVVEIVERMAALSRHIEGHLHSDTMGAVKPTPDLLLQEIEAFEKIRARLKAIRKTVAESTQSPK